MISKTIYIYISASRFPYFFVGGNLVFIVHGDATEMDSFEAFPYFPEESNKF
jgi:hypothetical protein